VTGQAESYRSTAEGKMLNISAVNWDKLIRADKRKVCGPAVKWMTCGPILKAKSRPTMSSRQNVRPATSIAANISAEEGRWDLRLPASAANKIVKWGFTMQHGDRAQAGDILMIRPRPPEVICHLQASDPSENT
jgi:hypothetical protein